MKNWTFKVVALAFAALAITACSKKKSNVAVPPPAAATANGLCTIGPNTMCVGQAAYTGSGRWEGQLMVVPAQMGLYQQFLLANRLCHGYACHNPTPRMKVSIGLNPGGRARVIIKTRRSVEPLSVSANVSTTDPNANFNMILLDPNMYYTQPNNSMQLSNTFISPYGDVITTTLFYRDVPIASGQLRGQRHHYNAGVQQGPTVLPYR